MQISHTFISMFLGVLGFIQLLQFKNTNVSSIQMFLFMKLPYFIYSVVSIVLCVGFAMNQWNIGY